MGRIFLDHLGGSRLFSCANCDTILTNRNELISTRFTGATGRAFLFNRVVNLIYRYKVYIISLYTYNFLWLLTWFTLFSTSCYSEVQDRVMLTGRHMVRDVSCKNCEGKLGWIYEFATEENQRYKEGRVILERALVTETDGIGEHMGDDWAQIISFAHQFFTLYVVFFVIIIKKSFNSNFSC